MNEHEYYCFLKEFWKVTNDGFIIVDPNGVIVDINETYCEFLGKTREQVLGKPIGEVISTTSMYDVLSSARDGDDNVLMSRESFLVRQPRCLSRRERRPWLIVLPQKN